MEPARTGERTGPPSVSVTTSASPSRTWSSSSPAGWRSQRDGSEKRVTPSVHRLGERTGEHTAEIQSPPHLGWPLLLEKKKIQPVQYLINSRTGTVASTRMLYES